MSELTERRRQKLLAARRMASIHHVLVFPLKPDSKVPAFEGWQAWATQDLAKIDAHWLANPDDNVGISTRGLLVVDLDKDKGGLESWAPIAEEHELFDEMPVTLGVTTQGGGRHLYFMAPEGAEVVNSVGKIAPGVDVRGDGGYVVGPGSYIGDRGYELLDPKAGRKIAKAPAWLLEKASRKRERAENAGEVVAPETPAAVELAWEWVREHAPVAREGEGGDLTTHNVAKRLFDFGVTVDTAREMFQWWNQNKAEPAWELDALEDKLVGGMKYREKPIGIASPDYMPQVPGLLEPVDISPIAAPSVETVEPPLPSRFLSFKELQSQALTHTTEPLIKGYLDMANTSVIFGPSNVGKSFFMMDVDFHIAAGRPWHGRRVKQGAVAWIAAEGQGGVRKRMRALVQHYGLEDVPIYVLPHQVDLLSGKGAKSTIAEIKALQDALGVPIVKVTIDTLARVMAGGNENAGEDMSMIGKHLDAIRDTFGCHVNIVHHTGKDATKGARGHSSLRGHVDTEIEVTKGAMHVRKQRDMDGDLNVKFGLKELKLGIDNRGDEVTSMVVVPRITTSDGLEPSASLLAGIKAKLRLDDMEGQCFPMGLVLGVAERKRLADFEKVEEAEDDTESDEDGTEVLGRASKAREAWRKRVGRLVEGLVQLSSMEFDKGSDCYRLTSTKPLDGVHAASKDTSKPS